MVKESVFFELEAKDDHFYPDSDTYTTGVATSIVGECGHDFSGERFVPRVGIAGCFDGMPWERAMAGCHFWVPWSSSCLGMAGYWC